MDLKAACLLYVLQRLQKSNCLVIGPTCYGDLVHCSYLSTYHYLHFRESIIFQMFNFAMSIGKSGGTVYRPVL
jgi:hypothetical protein